MLSETEANSTLATKKEESRQRKKKGREWEKVGGKSDRRKKNKKNIPGKPAVQAQTVNESRQVTRGKTRKADRIQEVPGGQGNVLGIPSKLPGVPEAPRCHDKGSNDLLTQRNGAWRCCGEREGEASP